jgi:hypothetical protein
MEDQAMSVASEIANCSMTPIRRNAVTSRFLREHLDTCKEWGDTLVQHCSVEIECMPVISF